MLNLLKLEPQVIEKLKAAGVTFSKRLIGEKTLRQIVTFSLDKQIDKIKEILAKI